MSMRPVRWAEEEQFDLGPEGPIYQVCFREEGSREGEEEKGKRKGEKGKWRGKGKGGEGKGRGGRRGGKGRERVESSSIPCLSFKINSISFFGSECQHQLQRFFCHY